MNLLLERRIEYQSDIMADATDCLRDIRENGVPRNGAAISTSDDTGPRRLLCRAKYEETQIIALGISWLLSPPAFRSSLSSCASPRPLRSRSPTRGAPIKISGQSN